MNRTSHRTAFAWDSANGNVEGNLVGSATAVVIADGLVDCRHCEIFTDRLVLPGEVGRRGLQRLLDLKHDANIRQRASEGLRHDPLERPRVALQVIEAIYAQ